MKKIIQILVTWVLTIAMITGSCTAVTADDWGDWGDEGGWDEGGGDLTAPSGSSADGVTVSVDEAVFPSGTSMKVVRVNYDNGYNPDAFMAYTGSDPVMYDVIFTNDSGSTEPSGSYSLTFSFSGQLSSRGLTDGNMWEALGSAGIMSYSGSNSGSSLSSSDLSTTGAYASPVSSEVVSVSASEGSPVVYAFWVNASEAAPADEGGDDGWTDEGTDEGTDDGWTDEGTDDGWTDEGTDDGGWTDEGTDDGGWTDEGTDDGGWTDEGTDDGGWTDEGSDQGNGGETPNQVVYSDGNLSILVQNMWYDPISYEEAGMDGTYNTFTLTRTTGGAPMPDGAEGDSVSLTAAANSQEYFPSIIFHADESLAGTSQTYSYVLSMQNDGQERAVYCDKTFSIDADVSYYQYAGDGETVCEAAVDQVRVNGDVSDGAVCFFDSYLETPAEEEPPVTEAPEEWTDQPEDQGNQEVPAEGNDWDTTEGGNEGEPTDQPVDEPVVTEAPVERVQQSAEVSLIVQNMWYDPDTYEYVTGQENVVNTFYLTRTDGAAPMPSGTEGDTASLSVPVNSQVPFGGIIYPYDEAYAGSTRTFTYEAAMQNDGQERVTYAEPHSVAVQVSYHESQEENLITESAVIDGIFVDGEQKDAIWFVTYMAPEPTPTPTPEPTPMPTPEPTPTPTPEPTSVPEQVESVPPADAGGNESEASSVISEAESQAESTVSSVPSEAESQTESTVSSVSSEAESGTDSTVSSVPSEAESQTDSTVSSEAASSEEATSEGTESESTEPADAGAAVTLYVEKVLAGREWSDDDSFSFELELDREKSSFDGEAGTENLLLDIDNSSADHLAEFDLNLQEGTWVYKVREIIPDGAADNGDGTFSLDDMIYDGSEYRFTAVVVKSEEDESCYLDELYNDEEGSGKDTVTFYNTVVEEPEPPVPPEPTDVIGSTEIFVSKEIKGRDWSAGDAFTFRLTAVGATTQDDQKEISCPLPDKTEVTATSDSRVTGFGKIGFVQPGYYGYTVEEVPPAGAVDNGDGTFTLEGMTYDCSPKTIIIIADDDGKGGLTFRYDWVEGSWDGSTVTITNEYNKVIKTGTGRIFVHKIIQGRDWTAGDRFGFTLAPVRGYDYNGKALTPPAPEGGPRLIIDSATADHTAGFGTITFRSPGVYVYSVKEAGGNLRYMTYDTNPHTVTVYVTDDGKEELTVTVKYDDTQATAVIITNVYQEPQPKGVAEIRVRKQLSGRSWQNGDSFRFKLEGTGGVSNGKQVSSPMPETIVVTATDGSVLSYGPIYYRAPGTYNYTIHEMVPAGKVTPSNGVYVENGLTYDISYHKVVVKVRDAGNGLLETRVSYDGTVASAIAIENRYEVYGSAQILVRKELKGRNWVKGDGFTFNLQPVSGTTANGSVIQVPMPSSGRRTVTVTDSTIWGFDKIYYSRPGRYQYVITETRGSIPGMNYDPNSYPVTVTVSRQSDGQLVTAVSYQNPGSDGRYQVITNTSRSVIPPLTGDDRNLAVYAVLLAAAAAAVIAVFFVRRRKK